ncbi:hypothetical protein, partial [Endozoicomonas sp. SESOKO2]|uniref:hypothetical protein n=1 Tax=Endozoicomonas sp. SESOKO2 TaxID=2828743 RepID=UPI00214818CF
MRLYIREARQQSEEEAWFTLQSLEAILKIKINEGDDKATRLERVLTRLDSGDVSNYELSNMDNFIWWKSERPDIKKNLERDLNAGLLRDDFVLSRIRDRLKFLVEESDQQAREQQANYLAALEKELNIYPHENPATKEKRKIFLAKLASDLQIGFADGANLSHQQQALRNKIQELIREQVNEIYDDEDLKRIRNNIIADQLKIENYKGLASTDEQNSLIKAKIEHLNEELFKAGQSEVDERIAAIENELERQMARLGPKPRFALDRDVAMTKRVIKKAESELSGVHRKLNNIRRKQVVYVSRTDVYPAVTDEDEKTLNQAIKQIQIDYDLPAGEEQTTEERVDDIRHFLRGDGTDRRDEVLEKLEAAIKNLNLQIHGYVGLMEEDDFFIAITSHTNTNDQDEAGYALGELPLTRQKYSQVNHFLRLHDWKSMEVTLAQREETKVKESLALKKEEHPPSGDIDEEAEALHNNEIAMLKSELEHKSQAVAEAKNALAGLKGTLATTEEAVELQPDSSDTYEHRVNALRNKQIQLGGDDGTGG